MALSKNDRTLFQKYNAKINRQLKRGVPSELLPSKISLRSLNPSKDQRQAARSFIRKGNQNTQFVKAGDIWVTRSEQTRFTINQSRANRLRKQYDQRFNDRKLRIISEEMQGIKRANPLKFGVDGVKEKFIPLSRSINSFKDRESFLRYFKKIERQSSADYFAIKDELYKQNFLKAIEKNLGDHELYDKISEIDAATVAEILILSDIDIPYSYGPEEVATKIEVIKVLFGL